MPLLSSLAFYSYLTYSSNGTGDEDRTSQEMVKKIKQNKVIVQDGIQIPILEYAAKRISENTSSVCRDILSSADLLISVPQSHVASKDSLQPTALLTSAMMKHGINTNINSDLRRHTPVQKSAYAGPGKRTRAERHYKTVSFKADLTLSPSTIILVDDVITQGSTLLGCASCIQDCFPNAEIIGFALVRTISNPSDFVKMADSTRGTITRTGQNCIRVP